MRIPLHKVYRAFPEFDRFPDARCEAYMQYVRVRYAASLWSVGITVWAGAAVASLLGLWPVMFAASRFARWYAGSLRPPDRALNPAVAVGAAVVMGGCALVAFVIRDVHLRRVMHAQLRGVTCAACSYNLLGAVVTGGMVRCPECGGSFVIAERNLRPEDFQVGRDDLPGVEDLPPRLRPMPPPAPVVLDPAEKRQLLGRVRTRRDAEVTSRGGRASTEVH